MLALLEAAALLLNQKLRVSSSCIGVAGGQRYLGNNGGSTISAIRRYSGIAIVQVDWKTVLNFGDEQIIDESINSYRHDQQA